MDKITDGLNDAQKDGADDEDEPDKEADEALKGGAADEQRRDDRHGVQRAADPACRGRVVAVHREHAPERLFPLFLRAGLRLRRGDALAAQQFVARHVKQFCNRGQHGDVGAGRARLPTGDRLIGDAQPVCYLLLGESLGFAENG